MQPDALVIDPAVAGGLIIAEVDDMPTATINVSVLALEDPDHARFGRGLPPSGSLLGRIRNRVPLAAFDQVVFGPVNRAFRALTRKHNWPHFPLRPRASRFLFLQPSVEALEYPRRALPAQVRFTGPLLPVTAADGYLPDWSSDLKTARAAGTPVVLVTQRTIATDSAELMAPTRRAVRSWC